jgi:arylsulfatase
LWCFASDHSKWLGEHLRYGKGHPGHDCVSRVPLLIRGPGEIASPGQTICRIVEALDVVPTLLEWAGISVPYHLQGQPLLPIMEGKSDEGKGSALSEMTGWKGLRTVGFQYVVEATGRETLYDLTKDPGGYYNVAAKPACASLLSEFRQGLLRRLIERERPLPLAWPY